MTIDSTRGAETRTLPLFYREPVVLHSAIHATWRLTEGDMAFAADTPYIPLVLGEFGEAGRCYPIVFAGKTLLPVALFGLTEGQNLFVRDHMWAQGHYVPAYVRRYPFGFVSVPGTDRFALAIDTASERLVREGEEGVPLFEQGEPGVLTRQTLQFCEAYQADFENTKAFADALDDKDLLVERRADATLPDGRQYALDGFRIVDADRLKELDDATIVDWHRNGWLSLIGQHLVSLGRFAALMDRQVQNAP